MFGISYSGIHWLYHTLIKFRGLIFHVLIGKKICGVRINFRGRGRYNHFQVDLVLIFVVHKFS